MSAFRLRGKKSHDQGIRMHLVYGLDFGGCETQMVNLAIEYAIRGRGDGILFCSLTGGGIAETKIKNLGFQVICLNLSLWEKPFTSLIRLIHFFRHYSILMLITSGSDANLFGGIAGRLAGARVVVTEEIGVRANSRIQRCFIRFGYKNANFNFAVSNLARENLLRQRLVDPKKCVVSYAPLNLIRENCKSVPYEGDIRLLYLGRIHPEKNLELLLDSLSQVLSKGQKNFRLVIVGARSAEEFNFLRAISEKLQISNNVEIQYVTDKSNEFIDECHFLVQSSRSEGMGYSVLEAISRNKPVISTDVGIVPEIIVDGVHGFVSKSHKQNDFVKVLSSALSIDSIKYQEMIENVSRIDLSFVATSKYLDRLDSLSGKLAK